MEYKIKICAIAMLLIWHAAGVQAQKITRSFRNASLSEALIAIDKANRQYNINFIYNELEDFVVTADIRNLSVPDAVCQVVGFYPMRITVGDSIISVECMQKEAAKLTGRLIDENGKPVEYANISLLSVADSSLITGGVSNADGRFVIPCGEESVIAKVTFVGYKTVYRRAAVGDMGTIRMRPDATVLGNVVVKGSSFIRKPDRVIIIPSKQQVKHSGTGYDLLYNLMIPGLDVDRINGSVSSATGGVTLYIDGRKADYREVQSLRPADVAKVEYMDAPEGKYSGDNIAINYVMRQYTSGGYVQFDAKQNIGYLKGDYNAVAKMQRGNTAFTLFAGHGMTEYGGDRVSTDDVIHFDGYDLTRSLTTEDAREKNNSQYAQLNIQNRNSRRNLMAKMSLIRNESPDNFAEQTRLYGGMADYATTSRSETYQRGLKPSLNLYGFFNTAKNQYLEANITGDLSFNRYNYQYDENGANITSRSKENLYTIMTQLSYGINIKDRNSLKFNLYHFLQISSTDYSGDTESWQHLWSGETLFFTAYNHRFGKSTLYFEPGVSQQLYRLHGKKLTRNTSPRLHLRFSTSPAKNQFLQISSAVGNSFPEISMVNSAEQAKDMVEIRRGNPDMNSGKLYNVTTVYSINAGRLNTQAVWMNDFFKDMPYIDYFTEGNRLIGMYNNNITMYTSTVFLSVSWKASERLNMQFNGSYRHNEISRGARKFLNAWKCGAMMNYYLGDIAFNVFAGTESHELNTADLSDVYLSPKYGASVNYVHGNWRMELSASNPLSSNALWKNIRTLGCYDFHSQIYSKVNQASASVKITYSFDYGKKTGREQNNVDRHINSAILKAK